MKTRKIFPYILFAFSLSAGCSSDGGDGKGPSVIPSSDSGFPAMLHSSRQLTYVKARIDARESLWWQAYSDFMVRAMGFLKREEHTVATLLVPKYYEETQEHSIAKEGPQTDAHAAYTCALAYRLGAGEKYARKAIYFLDAWANNNTAISHSSDDDSRLIAAAGLIGFLAAADLLADDPLWPEKDRNTFLQWLEQVYLPAVKDISVWDDNKGDWGTFATASAYHLLGDQANFEMEAIRIRDRIDTDIAPDGHMPKEVLRGTNGLWYTYYALTPKTMSARLVFNKTGTCLFEYTSPNGSSLKAALDYLLYYTQNKSEWPHHTMPAGGVQNADSPVDLFEAMDDFYADERYAQFTSRHRPVKGGYKSGSITHSGWFYPTLMKCPLIEELKMQ